MDIHLSTKEYRRLLDMAYIGNWVLNSIRGEDRFEDYDRVESLLFAQAGTVGMDILAQKVDGKILPSRAFEDGGIHEAIMEYETAVFFDILAEDLARRDMAQEQVDPNDDYELSSRMEAYYAEFEAYGTAHISLKNGE